MFKKNFKSIRNAKRAFTLIELLIVVTIIGILAAVILAALGNARTRGATGAVKSNLTGARSQAEVFFNTNTAVPNSYTNVCTNGIVGGANGIGEHVMAAARAASLSSYATNAGGSTTTATCNHSATAYAAEVPIPTTPGQMWCVDSTGKSGQKTGTSLGAGNDYTCL